MPFDNVTIAGSDLLSIPLLTVETGAALAILLIALIAPGLGSVRLERIQRAFNSLARRRGLAILAVAAFVLIGRALLIPVLPVPAPIVLDEFSYLFNAETFASGRLTNPTHKLFPFFETFFVLQQPTMASMYPPGSGLVLAVGKLLAGHPWIGVYVTVALMCAAFCWMLQAFFPPGWALFGAILVAMRIGLFSYWMNSYWGGALAALGGALVLGAAARVRRRPSAGAAALFGLGLVILANTRPYEGLLLGGASVIALLIWYWKRPSSTRQVALRRVAIPLTLIVVFAGSAMAVYFWRVTGSPFVMPYMEFDRQYKVAPQFVTLGVRPDPAYRHEVFREFARQEREVYHKVHSVRGVIRRNLARWSEWWLFYIGPIMSIPLLFLPRILMDRRMRFLILAGGAVVLGMSLELWKFPHYAAPIACVFAAGVVQGLRHLWVWKWRGKPAGRFLVRAVPAALAIVLVIRLEARDLNIQLYRPDDRPEHRISWCCVFVDGLRTPVLKALEVAGPRHLVFVRYGPDHDPNFEWVYNEPEIDSARVIWAHDMGPQKNRQLLAYYAGSGRNVWLLEPDHNPPRLSPYPGDDTLLVSSTSGTGKVKSGSEPQVR